jgi:hypothetical protein
MAFVVSLALLAGFTAPLRAQTLAQKNWAGSGVSIEPWWHRGVFYRIDPERFQDSTGSGHGDLTGIAQRLEYIQSLGVDAILLAPATGAPAFTPDTAGTGFDTLARGAVDHHLRLLVTLPGPESQAPAADAKLLNLARYWLNQGVAGLYIPTQALAKMDGGEHIAVLLRQLHALVASFPGGRILLADASGGNPDPALTRALAQNVQLTGAIPFSAAIPSALSLRTQLSAAIADPNPLLSAARIPAQPSPQQLDALNRTIAAMLLASRGAVVLDYGEELGLMSGSAAAPLMQWTPANVTSRPAPPAAVAKVSASPADTAFKPYIPPLPRDLFKPPAMPEIFATDHPVNPLRDPDALPGFTTGRLLQPAATNAATANVALEDTDSASLLSFYRHLIEMHHGNASLHNGLQTLQDHDGVKAMVWTRSAPPASRTAGAAVVVCNLSEKPLTLTLDSLHLHTGVRTLLGALPTRMGESITIPAYSVFLGEAGR